MRRLIALLAPVLLVVFPTAPANATISIVFTGGVLTISGDGEPDTIAVACSGSEVRVNGASPPSGAVGCDAVEELVVRAGGGGDRVNLSAVTRSAFGGLGSIRVLGEDGDDELTGSALADRLDGGPGVDQLRGGDGADRLMPGPGGGSVVGGEGRDRVIMSGGGHWTINDEHVVRITPDASETTLQGVELASLTGGSGDDAISASTFSGSVTLMGGRGDDLLQSGRGGDTLIGGGGDDWLDSGAGNDLLEGQGGSDVLRGGEGNDQLRAGPGDDTCVGGPGNDAELSC